MPSGIAHAAEKLVMLAEILVGANVEMVDVVGLTAIDGVIVKNTRLVRGGVEGQELNSVGIEPVCGKLIQELRPPGKICNAEDTAAGIERIPHEPIVGGGQSRD